MAIKEITRKILVDEPSDKDLFHGKGHERTADALVRALKGFKSADRAIGLDGPWGSGKSSVVGIAERKLRQANGNEKVRFHFFTFDIWKSQGSAFRRSFLEHLVSWSREEFPKKSAELHDIENKIRGKIREVDSSNQFNLDLYGIGILLAVPFLPIYVLWTKSVFDAAVIANQQSQFLCSWPMVLLYVFLTMTLVAASIKYYSSGSSTVGRFSRFKLALSQTLLIGAKQYEHQKVTQYIRETDPNDFEFQSVLREILSVIQDRNSKVVIVLDNIDRLPTDEIGEYWALVRSIFSRSHSDGHRKQDISITAIVPYDRKHIETRTEPSADGTGGLTPLSERELFSKTFDEILNVAPPVMSNTREFFDEKIRTALPEISDSDALFRVYLIFNLLITRAGGKATPRQVISYINEVSGLYSLHGGNIPLPTAAAYLAMQNTLEAKPSLLAQESTIDKQLRSLTGDESLEKHLAAVLFNVEPDLAFQILLDGQIEAAGTSGSSDLIINLSKAPGFGVRLNDVFVANVSAWASANQLAVAVRNFSELLEVYDAEGSSHLHKSMVTTLTQLNGISLGSEFELFQSFLKVCEPSNRKAVFEALVSAALTKLPADRLDQENGRRFNKALSDIFAVLQNLDPNVDARKTLSFVSLPDSPTFLFGFAAAAKDALVQMRLLSGISVDLTTDPEIFENLAIEQPVECISVFEGFHQSNLLGKNQWRGIAAALAKKLGSDEVDMQDFDAQLSVLSLVCSFLSYSDFEVEQIDEMLASASFYRNLHSTYAADHTQMGVAHALFLASKQFLAGSLTQPARTPRSSSVEVEFAWFNEIFGGSVTISKEQLDLFVDRLTTHYDVSDWVQYGHKNPDNLLAQEVVRTACARSSVPWIFAGVLLESYSYIKVTLGDKFTDAVPKLGMQLSEDDLKKITAASIPTGSLQDTKDFSQDEWKALHDKTDALLNAIDPQAWINHFVSADQTFDLLKEKATSSGFIPKSTALKDAFFQFVVGIINGSISAVPVSNYDFVIQVIDEGYHLDFYKAVRENLKSATSETLSNTLQLFPQTFRRLIVVGDKSKTEKVNLVRYFLRPGLEGGLSQVTDAFLELKRATVADFIRACDVSLKASLEPALRLFSNSQSGNRAYVQKVVELVQGKKGKSLFQKLWGGSSHKTDVTADDD